VVVFLSIFLLACFCPCAWFDPRNYSSEPNPQVELLKSYVSEEVLSKANPTYYTYFGFRDWWRFPLVYPYSIHTIDEVDHGCLYDESKVKNYEDINHQELVDMDICEITHLTLDKNYLLLQVEKEDGLKFIMFNFSTAEKAVFNAKDEMLAKAKELGFAGKPELMTLRAYDDLFW
jgi:hypothetical protein